MRKVRAGSVIRTEDGSLWYCAGNWHLKETPNYFPCILAYVPEDSYPTQLKIIKTIEMDGVTYVKVFGYFGPSLEIYRTSLMEPRKGILHPISFGHLSFLRKSHIVGIQDPRAYVSTFLQTLEGAPGLFSSLVEILGLSLEDIGISGSTLALGVPSWRHEIDFCVYGREKSKKVNRAIRRHRDDYLFSKASLPPYHLPFKYQGRWFDPQFSESDRERSFIHGASLAVIKRSKNVTLTIHDDQNGIFYPSVYMIGRGRRLISFKPSHRGLFTSGQKVFFSSLSLVRIRHANKLEEVAYAILQDEWGDIVG